MSSFQSGHTESDVELGERSTREDAKVPEEATPKTSAEKAKLEFRRSLQRIFSENRVNAIMIRVELWALE